MNGNISSVLYTAPIPSRIKIVLTTASFGNQSLAFFNEIYSQVDLVKIIVLSVDGHPDCYIFRLG